MPMHFATEARPARSCRSCGRHLLREIIPAPAPERHADWPANFNPTDEPTRICPGCDGPDLTGQSEPATLPGYGDTAPQSD